MKNNTSMKSIKNCSLLSPMTAEQKAIIIAKLREAHANLGKAITNLKKTK